MNTKEYWERIKRFSIAAVIRRLADMREDFRWWWHVYSGTKCRECADGYFYPQYGVAPHRHNLMRTGSLIGSTEVLTKDKWPDNFIEDKDAPGCGTFYCPNPDCKNSYGKTMERQKSWPAFV